MDVLNNDIPTKNDGKRIRASGYAFPCQYNSISYIFSTYLFIITEENKPNYVTVSCNTIRKNILLTGYLSVVYIVRITFCKVNIRSRTWWSHRWTLTVLIAGHRPRHFDAPGESQCCHRYPVSAEHQQVWNTNTFHRVLSESNWLIHVKTPKEDT